MGEIAKNDFNGQYKIIPCASSWQHHKPIFIFFNHVSPWTLDRAACSWSRYVYTNMNISQLCLAHFCDSHGPTPVMVTEGLPAGCSTCFDDDVPDITQSHNEYPILRAPDVSDTAPKTAVSTRSLSDVRRMGSQEQLANYSKSSSAVDTPPESPKLAAMHMARHANGHRRDSSFRKTYDENDRKRAIPCESCALTLPRKVQEQIPEGAPGSPAKNSKGEYGSPVLRTRKPYMRISIANANSPKSSQSDSDEADHMPAQRRRRRSSVMKRSLTATTISSISSSNSNSTSHNHYLDYTSTHDPISSNSFSILRASCLRTLSCETLPPNTAVTTPTTPTSPTSFGHHSRRSFSQVSSPTISTSGGPIFFGDPLAGYTTAYIFRIPDPCARGRRRVYAFMCLSTAKERSAMRAFSYLAAAFRDLAAWIQSLAEMEADRIDNESGSQSPLTFSTAAGATAFPQLMQQQPPALTTQSSPSTRKNSIAEDDSSKGKDKERKPSFTPTSSFLSGRAYDPDGFARRTGGIRSRGLAELVGRADFFIELHARFVALLAQLATVT